MGLAFKGRAVQCGPEITGQNRNPAKQMTRILRGMTCRWTQPRRNCWAAHQTPAASVYAALLLSHALLSDGYQGQAGCYWNLRYLQTNGQDR